MDRYELRWTRTYDFLFGIKIYTGREYYIHDNSNDTTENYSDSVKCIKERCKRLNIYDKAPRYRLFVDGNGVYFIAVIQYAYTNPSYSYNDHTCFKDEEGIWYGRFNSMLSIENLYPEELHIRLNDLVKDIERILDKARIKDYIGIGNFHTKEEACKTLESILIIEAVINEKIQEIYAKRLKSRCVTPITY